MATAQVPAASRSARLADDAATAALYVTHPERKKTIRDPTATEPRYSNPRATGATPNLSHASASAALAHARAKPVEVWRPGRLPAAEKAAFLVKDFVPPEFPQRSTQYSAEGLGAALLAVRDQRGMTSLQPTTTGHKHDISIEQRDAASSGYEYDKALRAATGAYASTRQRADSAPSEPVLDNLDSAVEASRIRHIANTNAQLYTATPPVAMEIEERNRRNSLRAAVISMAKDMYEATGPTGETGATETTAVSAAQRGQDRSRAPTTLSGAEGVTSLQMATSLQGAAQKRAAEKLARMQDENADYQEYYGTAPQPHQQRLRLPTLRKRTASEADASQIDVEQSQQIRNQMSKLQTKLSRVDEQREKDREMLMKAAQRNVSAAMQDLERRVFADTGRPPAVVQKEWDEAAQERVRQEAEAAPRDAPKGDRVNLGAQKFMDMADVEAVARSRVQPALDEITEQAEERRAHDVEERLDAEERQRLATIEKEREVSLNAEEKREKGSEKREKRESKTPELFLWRRMTKRGRAEKPSAKEKAAAPEGEVQEEAPQEPAPQEPEAAAAPEPGVEEAAARKKRESKTPKLFLWRRMTKRGRAEKPSAKEKAAPEGAVQEEAPQEAAPQEAAPQEAAPQESAPQEAAPQEAAPQETAPQEPEAAAAPEPGVEEAAAALEGGFSREASGQKAPEDLETTGAAEVVAAAPAAAALEGGVSREAAGQKAPEELEKGHEAEVVAAAPEKEVVEEPAREELQPEPQREEQPATEPGMIHPPTAEEEVAAGASDTAAMHNIRPVTSPRADSKLKTWFRDRIIRRSSTPVAVYPHQPGPEYNTDSEPGFAGGATLAGHDEPRGTALSSHPVTTADLGTSNASTAAPAGNETVTATTDQSVEAPAEQNRNGSGNGNATRGGRLRRTFMKTVTRTSQEPKTNGVGAHQPAAETDTKTAAQDLRNSATEQGLPPPPSIGDTVSTRRESRFSEDL